MENVNTAGDSNSSKKLGIITFIMQIFKESDEHKVSNFFNRQIKNLNRNIKDAKQNITVLQNQMENLIAKETDDVEDAQSALKNAFSNISLNNLGSYAEMDDYAVQYWENIKNLERKLETIQAAFNKQKEEVQKEIDFNQEQINLFQKRIDTLTEFK